MRERMRVELGEPYRTLLGHLRHEIGHYYWDRLVRDGGRARGASARLFGDERADYDEALRAPLPRRPAADWHARYVSAYATMHPWEDWAETWAHYLHMVDTLETARSFGLASTRCGRDPTVETGDRASTPYRDSTTSTTWSRAGCRSRSRSTA